MSLSYKLLERLADLRLPATFDAVNDVDVLRSYLAAGLITAEIPDIARRAGGSVQSPARVLSVTPEGQRTLRRHKHRSTWAGNQAPGRSPGEF